MSKRILVAGIGNIFLADDAFGVETVRQLAQRGLPDEVRIVDFGIRSHDLAYAIADGYDAVILVDAASRGESPGTVYLIEPELASPEGPGDEPVDPHSMDLVRVLQMARSLGTPIGRVYLAGCEPGNLDPENGGPGLSDAVQAAVPKAVEMIETLVRELLQLEKETESGLAPV